MIVVKIELWPHGLEQKAKELYRAHIWNDGTGTKERGDYSFKLFRKYVKDRDGLVLRQGDVKEFRRDRLNAWHLLRRVLDQWL